MSKRARRLWLGDWQRDAEETARPADQEDTVTILPDDEPVDEAAALRRRNRRRTVVSAAAVAVLAGLILRIASGGDDTPLRTTATQVPPAQTPQAQPQPQPQLPATPQVPQGGGFGAPDLTGPAATKAAQAAQSKFPGDIERVTAGPGGDGYIVHVIQGDGNEVHVAVSDEFKVLGSDAGRGPGFGGGGAAPSGPSNSS